jgi:hypothetical protein
MASKRIPMTAKARVKGTRRKWIPKHKRVTRRDRIAGVEARHMAMVKGLEDHAPNAQEIRARR